MSVGTRLHSDNIATIHNYDINHNPQANTFQGILITNGTASYTVFTYRCGSMGWSLNGATIGYNAAGNYFENHPNTGSFVSHEIACLNSPGSEWFSVVYNISVDTPGTLAPPPTVEPGTRWQLNYQYFEH